MGFLSPRDKDNDDLDLRLSSSPSLSREVRAEGRKAVGIEHVRGRVLRQRVVEVRNTSNLAIAAYTSVGLSALQVAQLRPELAPGAAFLAEKATVALGLILDEQAQ